MTELFIFWTRQNRQTPEKSKSLGENLNIQLSKSRFNSSSYLHPKPQKAKTINKRNQNPSTPNAHEIEKSSSRHYPSKNGIS